jgi:CHAT domain-containing protein
MADPDYDLSPADANKLAANILSRRPPGIAVVQARPPGNPSFAVRGDSGAGLPGLDGFERLKGTASEAEKSRQKFRQLANQEPSVFLQQQALEKVFKAALSPRFVFLGTHGFALSSRKNKRDNPLAVCGLALAGANKHAGARGEEDDGILTGLEIIGTDLRGTELVVLSACDTGLGKAADGEGVLGLRQAFQLAGAQTVIATLWSVPDNPKLVEDYLTGLADGADRAEALQKAQVAMLEYRRKRYGDTHPFYWAAFTATGEVKKLSP